MQLEHLSIEELKKLMSRETRVFIDALDSNTNIDELKAIRKRITEIKELIEKKTKLKETQSK